MKWWQTQEFIGNARGSMGAAASGKPYLSQRDFLRMMGVALAVHVLFFIGLALFPDDKVTNIPVRALSFKLGDQDRIAAYDPTPGPAATASAPVMNASSSGRVTPSTPTPPKPVKPAKVEPKPQPKAQPKPQEKPEEAEPPFAPMPAAQPAIAPNPQQYVREVGQAKPQQLAPLPRQAAGNPDGAMGGVGNVNTQTEQTSKEIRDRYEQQISGWIERHKVYPAEAGGREGRVVVRMRIDRSGVVRYYALEQSCGVPAIDSAALDMIRRANPVPAAPYNYPGGNLIEFLIPITFQAP